MRNSGYVKRQGLVPTLHFASMMAFLQRYRKFGIKLISAVFMKEYTCFRKPNKLETINIFNILFKLEVGKANNGK